MHTKREKEEKTTLTWFFDRYNRYLKEAETLSAKEKYDEAIQQCKLAIEEHEDIPEAYIALGNIYVASKRHEEAILQFQKARALIPHSASTYKLTIKSLRELKRTDEAKVDISIGIGFSDHEIKLKKQRMAKLQRYSQKSSQEIDAIQSKKGEEFYVLAMLASEGDAHEATKIKIMFYYTKRALGLFNEDIASLYLIGNAYLLLKENEMAVGIYQQLTRAYSYTPAHHIMMLWCIEADEVEEARKHFIQYLLHFDEHDLTTIESDISEGKYQKLMDFSPDKAAEYAGAALKYAKKGIWVQASFHYALAALSETKVHKKNKYFFLHYLYTSRSYFPSRNFYEIKYNLLHTIKFLDHIEDKTPLIELFNDIHTLAQSYHRDADPEEANNYYNIGCFLHQHLGSAILSATFLLNLSQNLTQLRHYHQSDIFLQTAFIILQENNLCENTDIASLLSSTMIIAKRAELKSRHFVPSGGNNHSFAFHCTTNPLQQAKLSPESKEQKTQTNLLNQYKEYNKLTEKAEGIARSNTAIKSAESKKIRKELSRAIALCPNLPDAYFLRFFMFYIVANQAGEEQFADLNKAISLLPLNSEYHEVQANVHRQQKEEAKEKEAGSHAKIFTHMEEEYFRVYFERLNKNQNIDETIFNKNSYRALAFSAMYAMETYQYELALYYLTTMIDEYPPNFMAYIERAHCLLMLGDTQAALIDINHSISLEKDAKAFWLRSLIHDASGNVQKAKEDMIASLLSDYHEERNFRLYYATLTDTLRILDLPIPGGNIKFLERHYETTEEPIFRLMSENVKQFVLIAAKEQLAENYDMAILYYTLAICFTSEEKRIQYYPLRSLVLLHCKDYLNAVTDILECVIARDESELYSKKFIDESKAAFSQQCHLTALNDIQNDKIRDAIIKLIYGLLVHPTKSLADSLGAVLHQQLSSQNRFTQNELATFQIPEVEFQEKFNKLKNRLVQIQNSQFAPTEADYMQGIRKVFLGKTDKNENTTPQSFAQKPKKRKQQNSPKSEKVISSNKQNPDTTTESPEEEKNPKPVKSTEHRNKKTQAKRKFKKLNLLAQRQLNLIRHDNAPTPDEKYEIMTHEPEQKEYSIPLLQVEDQVLALIDNYVNTTLIKDSGRTCLPATYLVGGFVESRYRALLESRETTFAHHIIYDCDTATELSEAEIIAALQGYPLFKSPHKENLFQLRLFDPQVGIVNFDIRYNQNLGALEDDARERCTGNVYAKREDKGFGKIVNPLGDHLTKALLEHRIECYTTLNTYFTNNINPLRILILIYKANKNKDTLEEKLEEQLIKDVSKLSSAEISPYSINAKLKKNFLTGRALDNFNMLYRYGVIAALLPAITQEIKQDITWIQKEMNEIDSANDPSLYQIYSILLVSAACRRLDLTRKYHTDANTIRFMVQTHCEMIIKEKDVPQILKVLFTPRVDLKALIIPLLASWIKHTREAAKKSTSNRSPLNPLDYASKNFILSL